MLRFVTDQRHRATHGLPSLSMKKADGTAFATTQASRRLIFNHVRRLLRNAMDSGETDRIGLDRGFVIAAPSGGKAVHRTRTPFSDDVARALAATTAERRALALFPTRSRNLAGQKSLSYSWFSTGFKQWIAELNLGTCVPHQARHTLATTLLRHGASLTHIRRYLGQVSDRMAEHYTHVAVSEIEDVLQHVWVAGPAAPHPGELLSGDTKAMSREQAHALAIDLSRRSTAAEGGFCTFQPVVNGDACPWKLDCHNCDKFVLSGADLLYWRRKREQWRSIAERAPDDATADYLHQVFEPTGRAIDGLEKALAGMGLLDEALALDLRRPQDYFHRIWESVLSSHRTHRRLFTRRQQRFCGASTVNNPRYSSRTAAATAARQERTAAALQRVHDAIARMRREKTPITAAGVARRAGVSRTFLYENPEARTAVSTTRTAATADRAAADAQHEADIEATWRERALNAEATLKTAHEEIIKQRNHIGDLMGQIRDLESEWSEDSILRITTENTTLKQQVRQLTHDNQKLDERLKAARSNVRFQDRQIADLEMRLLDPAQSK
ncbi:DUF6262 family protein [Saccharopolyspora sp. NPDC003752]